MLLWSLTRGFIYRAFKGGGCFGTVCYFWLRGPQSLDWGGGEVFKTSRNGGCFSNAIEFFFDGKLYMLLTHLTSVAVLHRYMYIKLKYVFRTLSPPRTEEPS